MKTVKTALLLSSLICAQSLAQVPQSQCVPANEYVSFSGKAAKPNRDGKTIALGTYSRIGPDGRYVLRSLSGDNLTTVTLMEVVDVEGGGKVAIAHETDLKNEAFPVQGTWRFINGIDGDHYRLSDIVRSGESARRQFRGGITGFYATAAEMPGGTDASTKIRSLSWPNSGLQEVSGYLKNIVLEVRKDGNGHYSKSGESAENTMCENLRKTEGTAFSLPMISADGMEFSALPQNPENKRPSIRVYSFGPNDKDCKMVDDLGFVASKVIFGFPQKGKKAPMVFLGASTMLGEEKCHLVTEELIIDPNDPTKTKTINVKLDPPRKDCHRDRYPVSGIHIYDREFRRVFFMGDRSRPVSADSFPGMTRDGRVMYGAKWQDCKMIKQRVKSWDPNKGDKDGMVEMNVQSCEEKTGYVLTDPNQTEDMKRFRKDNPDWAIGMKECITKDEVKKVEEEQRAIYGLGARPPIAMAPAPAPAAPVNSGIFPPQAPPSRVVPLPAPPAQSAPTGQTRW